MILQIKNWVENHFNLCLLGGFVLGLVLPGMEHIPPVTVLWMTGAMIYFSCAKITVDHLQSIDILHVGVFTMVRFIVLPVALFYMLASWQPELGPGILLLALAPAGVSVAVLCSVTGGNVALGLAFTVVSSLLAPAIIPATLAFIGSHVQVDVWDLFMTLCFIVFVPIFLYFLAAVQIKPVREWTGEWGKFSSTLLLAGTTVVIVGTKRDVIFTDMTFLWTALLVLMVIFGVCYLFGILSSLWATKENRISYIFASGTMNNALVIALSFIYFSDKISLFMVLSDVVWTAYVALFQTILQRRKA